MPVPSECHEDIRQTQKEDSDHGIGVQRLLFACFRHEKGEDAQRSRGDPSEEQEAGVRAYVVNDTACDGLAQSCADADGSGDGSEREVEPDRAACQIGDHEYGHDAKDPAPTPTKIWMATSNESPFC
jgi:hypothetical protein